MMRRILLSLGVVAVLAMPAAPAVAAVPPQFRQVAVCGKSFVDFLGLEPWYSCVQDTSGKVAVNRLNQVWLIVLTLLEDAVKLGVYIAAGFLIWGGVKYLKSQGEGAQISQAKDVIRNSIVGLVITLLAVAIVQFIATGISA